MSLLTFVLLGLTVLSLRLARTQPNEVGRVLAGLVGVACLIAGLTTASVLVKSLILLSVMLYPVIVEKHKLLIERALCSRQSCSRQSDGSDYSTCPQYAPRYPQPYSRQYPRGTSHDRYLN
ncbi:hypothetical protein [cf. Phormidesmis sp. LEGE 11477]|uniref:hypothetical protein n=1 Tax=cf. Phormidesmis sp. LEGE 11477 TaxID=1828680 RepID=UPI00187F6FAB|nr:hypothetical protein [cf. Phormidesmis sp. LEGE 11477]MBE9059823.1 hypothetical protein [cf. Phormidesmis sp. LEGE 11477]